jgi:hypothetical protein
VVFSAIVVSMTAINFWLYLAGLVLPLASVLVGHDLHPEHELQLFRGETVQASTGSVRVYVPPGVVDGWSVGRLQRETATRELVMFCVVRGFPLTCRENHGRLQVC